MSDIDLKALRPDAVELHRQGIEFASGDREPVDLDLMAFVAGAVMLLPMIDRLESAERRAEEAEKECAEQARLVGMGAERELALMAKLGQAEKERDEARGAAVKNGQDAERYRFMRSEGLATTAAKIERIATSPQFDAAIDAAMAQEGGK